jgi:4-diphosphocytidyl-2-C-methyl-D-erythritol kinase
MSESLILRCPSKLNLTLEVLKKKDNGMHEIKSHFQLIDLCDVMHIEKSNAQQSSIRTNASIDIDSKKNLAYQAIEALSNMFHKSSIAILLLKKIFPLGEV